MLKWRSPRCQVPPNSANFLHFFYSELGSLMLMKQTQLTVVCVGQIWVAEAHKMQEEFLHSSQTQARPEISLLCMIWRDSQ